MDLFLSSFAGAFADYFEDVSATFSVDPFIGLFYFVLAPILVPVAAFSLFFSQLGGTS